MASATAHTTGTPVELEFDIRDEDCFFVSVSKEKSCTVTLEHLVRRSDNLLLEFFSISGAEPEYVLAGAEAASNIDQVRLVDQSEESSLYAFLVSGRCVTTTLADAGAITQSVSAADGKGHIVATVPRHVPVRDVVETFQSTHDETTLVAQRAREQSMPVRSEQGAFAVLCNSLTDKQLEVLRTAFVHGYFDWPRGSTADECAEALGISQPTFSQHIRTAQQKVFAALLDDSSLDH